MMKRSVSFHLEIPMMTKHYSLADFSTALYDISQLSFNELHEEDYFHQLHQVVNRLMSCDNFMIIFYKHKTNMLEIAYFADQKDHCPVEKTIPFGKGISSYVISQAKPVLLNASDIATLIEQRQITSALGHLNEIVSWLGIPMFLEGKVQGILVVQSYNKNICYSNNELDLLSYVATHLATNIERRKIQQERNTLLDKLNEQHAQLSQAYKQLEQSELSLIQEQKMASIGKLAQSIAHQINSPLAAIVCNTAFLKQYISHLSTSISPLLSNLEQSIEDDLRFTLNDATLLVDENSQSLEHIQLTISQLTGFHTQHLKPEKIKLRPVLDSALLLLKSSSRCLAEITIECDAAIEVTTIKPKLVQVIYSLLENALLYGKAPFIICVTQSSSTLTIDIIDHGAGIPLENHATLFSIKQHDDQNNKGLGLALCVHCVQELSGKLCLAYSTPEKTCFRIELPLTHLDPT